MSEGPVSAWLMVAEIAAMARMHPQSVYRHLRSARLPGRQFVPGGVWRAHVTDVDAWLAGLPPVRPGPARRGA